MNKKRSAILLPLLLLLSGNQGTMKWTFDNPVQIGGKQVDAGSYLLRWKADGAAAQISVELKGKPVAETTAKVTERQNKADSDSVAIGKNAQGADMVKEIRLGGKKTVFVLE